MGKITGFMEFQRQEEDHLEPAARLKNYKEFTLTLTNDQAKVQGARCMDCGIPFCNTGCPVNNQIPDWNDLVYHGNYRSAVENLHSTNNFPEFTGRICPAPCEAACTLGINNEPVGIKSIERKIADAGWEHGWIVPQPAAHKTGKTVAIIGSGPAGLAAAQQLARAGHDVTVFEKSDRLGGLLRYGIPDFKMEKDLIDRRIEQMKAEGVTFRTSTMIGKDFPTTVSNMARETIFPEDLAKDFDAIIMAGGAEQPRDLPVPGRELKGVHFAMDFLPQQNRVNAGDKVKDQIKATGKHVVVIGGGDTGSDCVGTSNRHGAASVAQFELMPQPPELENKPLVWPYWPTKLRTSSSHDEGCSREFAIATKEFMGEKGKLTGLKTVQIEFKDGRLSEVSGTEKVWPAELVLLAMGFTNPMSQLLQSFGVDADARGNAKAGVDEKTGYKTSADKVWAAGDVRRGQSLVVWAIREGRQAARAIDLALMGTTALPR